MISEFKQFVPSAVCLKCDGCCRFKSADSPWRPRMGEGEKNALALQVTAGFSDDKDYIKTIEDCGNQLCRFFNKNDSTCRVYDKRPFECALYPFILSKTNSSVIKVYVHLACPYVQDMQADIRLQEYIAYLESFFNLSATVDFLRQNKGLLHDYAPFEAELQYLFAIEGFES